MASAEELRAQLKMVELEDKLVEAKGTESGPTVQLRRQVREARRAFRELREARAAGEGVARPATIETAVTEVSGGQ